MQGESALPLTGEANVAAFYYAHHLQGAILAPINDMSHILSPATSAMLESHQLKFDNAPGLLQRALIWDSGLLSSTDFDGNQRYTQIFTRCGADMASLSLSAQVSDDAGCGSSTSILCDCRDLAVSNRCAVRRSEFPNTATFKGASVRIWDADKLDSKWTASELQPHIGFISVMGHQDESDIPAVLFGLPTSQCLQASKVPCLPYVVTPCTVLETDPGDNDGWCLPQPSTVLKQWIYEYQTLGKSEAASVSSDDSSGTVTLATVAMAQPTILPDMMLGTTGISVPDPAARDVGASLTSLWSVSSSGNPISMTADLARDYFRLHELGSGLDFELSKAVKVPQEVNARLRPFQINFGQLSGLLRLALLWDSGYVLATDTDEKPQLVPVWVRCGLRMADIAVPRTVFELAGCAVSNCTSYNASTNVTITSLHSNIATTSAPSCSPPKLTTTTLCAIDTSNFEKEQVSLAASNASIWSVGPLSVSSAHVIPHPSLKRHQFIHGGDTTELYGIHTHYLLDQTEQEQLNGQQCPLTPSLVVPCVPLEQVSGEDSDNWCRPEPSHLVSAWLVVEERQYRTLFHLVALGMAVILAIAIDLYFDRKPRRVRAAASVGAVALPSVASSALDFDPERNSSTHLSALSAMSGMSSRQTGGVNDWD